MDKNIAIEVKELSKRYRNTETLAINHLSLEVESGEIFGLLGPNGAGKTTIISVLCNFITATSGEVMINGINLKSDADNIKKIIGVVPQEIALFPNLTAYENLRFFGNMYGLKGNILKEKIIQLIKTFGLANKAHQKIHTYSGGMKRRMNLIAGILHSPEILFLDEPTVGIDVQSRAVIIEYLKKLNELGTTIVYTSHHMEEAEKFCTKIAIIDMGKIIIEGSPAGLLRKYSNCYNLEDVFLEITGRSLRD
ncbi:MAG: ABC transporter ATP-binding protein [Bacteroidetes bacterium]|nr:ABC transporter ATP-binding protein [Bacteroidota bacterium]MBL6943276.1 ABC transporter ATP-binding protein [Bacteroidales bacterium]